MAKSKKQDKELKAQAKASSHVESYLDVIKPEKVISTSADDISVFASGADDVEHEYIYNDSTTSAVISNCVVNDLELLPETSYQEKFIQGIEQVKGKYVKEFELEVGWPGWPLLKIKIQRAPEKIIKFFKAKETKRKSNK